MDRHHPRGKRTRDGRTRIEVVGDQSVRVDAASMVRQKAVSSLVGNEVHTAVRLCDVLECEPNVHLGKMLGVARPPPPRQPRSTPVGQILVPLDGDPIVGRFADRVVKDAFGAVAQDLASQILATGERAGAGQPRLEQSRTVDLGSLLWSVVMLHVTQVVCVVARESIELVEQALEKFADLPKIFWRDHRAIEREKPVARKARELFFAQGDGIGGRRRHEAVYHATPLNWEALRVVISRSTSANDCATRWNRRRRCTEVRGPTATGLADGNVRTLNARALRR